MKEELKIDKSRTAVVVIDLQKGITGMPAKPYMPETVVENVSKILDAARKTALPVFLVRVTPSPDMKDALRPIAETSFKMSGYTPEWSEYVPQLNIQPGDFLITKHQWGAFYGTELELQLRRRGMNTIILCGIAANMGVESTARNAYELGFNQIFVSDGVTARSDEEYEYPFKYIFPRLGLIYNTEKIIKALA